MPWRLKYPQAPERVSHYRDLVTKLTANRTIISTKVNRARTVNAPSVDPNSVDGEYYDRYIIKRDAWIQIHGRSVAEFDTFLTDLDSCIASASSLESLWQGRIGVMEEYV